MNERDSLLVCHTENSSSKEYLKTSDNIFIALMPQILCDIASKVEAFKLKK